MVILDVAVVNVALPSMRNSLHFSTSGLQWVVNAYTLTFAGFLMLGGRAADLLGRRRVFIVGVALFALSSLACALADSRSMLLTARALQGFGGAVVSPATLSIITSSLREGPERNRGLGAWGAIGGLGASSGALLGGVLTQTLGWPAIFAVNVPLGALVIVLGLRVLATEIRPVGPRHFDATGAMLVTGGLVSLTAGNPSRRLGLYPRKGVLEPGSDADLALVDLQKTWTLQHADLRTRWPINPFVGRTFTGQVHATVVRGTVVWRDGGPCVGAGFGQPVRR